MADIPHFALPFRYEDGKVVTNEQDSLDDVADCVEAILRTRPGERPERPDFGVPDLAFRQLPLDKDGLAAQIEDFEPRVRLLIDERPERFDEALDRVVVKVSLED